MATRRSRTIVGSPLTPGMLEELGAVGEFPPRPASFNADGNWVNTYRVWTCHGYRESGNDDKGFLKIERVAGKDAGQFNLIIDQQILHDDAMLNVIHAEAVCRNDSLASPVRWQVSSRFIGPEGDVRTGLGTEKTGRVSGGRIEVTTNGRKSKGKRSRRLAADWCLFEAVQRLPFGDRTSLAFDVLEGLSVLRRGHRLSYRGIRSPGAGIDMSLHGFHQLGHGTLPYEYWLDDGHRLVMAVTFSRVYVLDQQAETTTERELEESRRSFRERKQAREGGVR